MKSDRSYIINESDFTHIIKIARSDAKITSQQFRRIWDDDGLLANICKRQVEPGYGGVVSPDAELIAPPINNQSRVQ